MCQRGGKRKGGGWKDGAVGDVKGDGEECIGQKRKWAEGYGESDPSKMAAWIPLCLVF